MDILKIKTAKYKEFVFQLFFVAEVLYAMGNSGITLSFFLLRLGEPQAILLIMATPSCGF
jgi:hypothetical protein